MASETPKKVVDEISKCFLCSSPSAAQERVFIFGNSTHNFRSSLDFDISCLLALYIVTPGPAVIRTSASTADKFFSRVSYLPSYVFLRRRRRFTSRKLYACL